MQLFNAPPKNYQPTIIPDDVPVYRVNDQKFYADDRLFEEGKIIVWEEEPNKGLEPLNAMAMDRYNSFLEKLDVHGKEVAAKLGKAYISETDAFANMHELAKEDGKRVNVLNERQGPALLGGKQRRKRKVKEIELAAAIDKPEIVNNKATVNQVVSETGLEGSNG